LLVEVILELFGALIGQPASSLGVGLLVIGLGVMFSFDSMYQEGSTPIPNGICLIVVAFGVFLILRKSRKIYLRMKKGQGPDII
jgi:hypothetical protein